MSKDFIGSNYLKTQSPIFKYNRVLSSKHDRIVAIIKATPEISMAEIRNQYYSDGTSPESRKNLGSMLLQLCCDNRIKLLPGDRYIAVEV